MAITTNTVETSPLVHGTTVSRWKINASTVDASGAETVKAAPGAGYELVVQKFVLTIGGAATVTLGSGEESSAVKRTVLGPLGGAAMVVPLDFGEKGLVLDPNTALTVDASGAATVWIYAEGITRVTDSAGIASSSPSSSLSASPSSSISASVSSSASSSVSSSVSASAS